MAIAVLVGVVVMVVYAKYAIESINARQEAKLAEEINEQARIEAIDKMNEGIVADFSAVKEGMDFDEVLEIVGEPYEKDVTKANEEYVPTI